MSAPWSTHCRPAELLADSGARSRFRSLVGDHGLELSALSCHANPLHPDREIAAIADRAYRDTVQLAAGLGVETVVTFSGCPGESEQSLRPSWVTCSWPDDYPETLAWQWEERVLPYWDDAAAFARSHGIRVAIEPHPGFVVYNTASLLRLREAVGAAVGVNFDPSHLFWQQMDPLACVRALGDAIFHVHAKDTGFQEELLALNGVLETIPAARHAERSWSSAPSAPATPSRSGGSSSQRFREVGYDGALSIEHEDPLLSREEGLAFAVSTLAEALAP